MLFNSYVFIFLFVPVTLIGYFFWGKQGYHRTAILWLVGASLFYYGWWEPIYLWLILVSILFNYVIGMCVAVRRDPASIWMLIIGILGNLGFLGYFKYANFFIDNVNNLFAAGILIDQIALPLAISFFTFQQIAYLVDSWKTRTYEKNFLYYCLFVTFFPQLIAGPIVHHKEMLPQFIRLKIVVLNYENIAVGLSIFFLGLFKKVVLADTVAGYATPNFDLAATGNGLTFADAWVGAFAYTFQLYFDFSGYSDMSIGLAKMFGILLPINFISPYKALNIIDFWRRWHVTLSKFLRNYLYFSLGGNRKGAFRRYVNLMITMVLGGLWHGASWTFVLWGGLHGLFLMINHLWRAICINKLFASIGKPLKRYPKWVSDQLSWTITFLCVVVAWVFFRAENIDTAFYMIKTMFGANGIFSSLSINGAISNAIAFMGCLLLTVRILPNSIEIMALFNPVIEKEQEFKKSFIKVFWTPTKRWAFLYTAFAIVSLYSMITKGYHEFIYRFF